MGLTINVRHRTKSLNKLRELFKDLEIWANNTGRYFKVYSDMGKSSSIASDQSHIKDMPYQYSFTPKEYLPYGNDIRASVSKGFEIEIKSGTNDKDIYIYGLEWFKRGEFWICKDYHKVYGPSTDPNSIFGPVMEIIGILMWIKKFHFPDLKVDDETDFYVSYDEKTENQKQFWRDIVAGKFSSYKREDGSFPDYESEYKKLKSFDPKNIGASIGSINQVFSKIDKMLYSSGYSEDNIKRDFPIKTLPPKVSKTIHKEGYNRVYTFVDNINNTIISKKKPAIYKPMPFRRPIERVKIKRKDGVTQHYLKRLGGK
jgi:hypothetical protein